MTEITTPNILIIDDIPENLRMLGQMLTAQGYSVRPITDGVAAVNAALAAPPDLILLDILMPGMDGYQVCQELKAHESTRSIPVIFLSALTDTKDKIKAFQAGGVDFITKPFQYEEVIARVRTHLTLKKVLEQLEETNLELELALAREEQLARTDWLTGIANSGHFFELAVHEFHNSVRYQHPLVVLMIDVDHFKDVNDRYGHPAGDVVLKHIAQVIAQQMRSGDVFARYGGEEFIALLPMTTASHAQLVAERILSEVQSMKVATSKGLVGVTISAGIAERLPEDDMLEHVIEHADQALYAAKDAGRNCVMMIM